LYSTLFRRGAPGQGADAVSTTIHGGAAAAQKEYLNLWRSHKLRRFRSDKLRRWLTAKSSQKAFFIFQVVQK